ncbi:MAG TPA: sugar ABC transporter permease [Chloroflexia bacterium]|nr:sugar ABC transporter permease [Chloroflexia bacterium]
MKATVAPPELKLESRKTITRRHNINRRLVWRLVLAGMLFALALFVRLRAVDSLPADFDEDDYLRAGQFYAQHIAAGDVEGVINESYNYEHPPLTKLLYGTVLFTTRDANAYANPVNALTGDQEASESIISQVRPLRTFSAVFGALTVGLVALVSPLAALMVALNSWHIKYTSQAYLEALPCIFAALTLLLLTRSRKNGDSWFWAAALTLGITAAGKYLYAVGGFAAIGWLLWRERHSWKLILAWGALALCSFYIFDPALWPDPLGRLVQSLTFSLNYTTGTQVQQSVFGWAQPANWLLTAVPTQLQALKDPSVFPLMLDGLFSVLGLLAIRPMWRARAGKLFVLWFGVNMFFLFFWPTKWPQYILTVTVPISIMAARTIRISAGKLRYQWQHRRAASFSEKRERREALFWLTPSLVLLGLLVLYPLLLQTALATTYFQITNLREGAPGLLNAFGRGLLGVPAGSSTRIPYVGTGAIFSLLMDQTFVPTIRFNFVWAAITMTLATVLGLWLANLLQRRGLRRRIFWRTIFILPWAIPEFVGALIWSTLFDDVSGGVNNFITSVDATGRLQVKWLSDPNPVIDFVRILNPLTDFLNSLHLNPLSGLVELLAESLSTSPAFWVLTLVGVWVSFPFMMLVSTVALRSIPMEVAEAARVDGAKGHLMWRYITWPLIRPSIWSGVLLRGILLFNAFQIPLMIISGNSRSGTTTLSLYAYQQISFLYGYSGAALVNTIIMGLVAGMVWIFNQRTRVVEGVDYI